MQLERILQKHGFGSRKACRELVRQGRVAIAGRVCADPVADIATAGLVFTVDGVAWPYAELATVLLHKPAGYECSRQPQHHPSVLALLPPPLRERGLQPVGRLDADATGLLLLTDDGQLNHALASGRRQVAKVYLVTTKHPLDEQQLQRLRAGVVLRDDPEPLVAAACERLGERRLRLTITEGRYHQVKRMVAAAGNRVEALHRVAIGGLVLPEDLRVGEWRWLGAAELAQLDRGVA